VYSVSDGILWDVDYDDEHLYLDRSPEEVQALRELTRINEDYYLSIAKDLKSIIDVVLHCSIPVF
jgi:hypothetical protein